MTPVNRDLQRLNQKSLQVSTSLGFTASTPVCSTNTVETQTYFLYAKKNTHKETFTHRCLSFTQSNFYTQKPLHTYAFTQSITKQFFTDRPSHTLTHRCFYTQKRFTRRNQCVCTQKLLHTDAFAQRILHSRRSFYTHTPLHTESFYTQRLLHREVFTQSSFYTQELLRTEAFAQSSFMVAILSLLGTRKTICDNIFPTQRSHPCLTNFLVEAAVQCHRFLQHFQCLKRSAVETRGAWKDF